MAKGSPGKYRDHAMYAIFPDGKTRTAICEACSAPLYKVKVGNLAGLGPVHEYRVLETGKTACIDGKTRHLMKWQVTSR